MNGVLVPVAQLSCGLADRFRLPARDTDAPQGFRACFRHRGAYLLRAQLTGRYTRPSTTTSSTTGPLCVSARVIAGPKSSGRVIRSAVTPIDPAIAA